MRTRRGFTLIELLVVIAIIAILAAILFPVFARARRTAQAANCESNMKQIGQAIKMYLSEWQETFPTNRPFTGGRNLGRIMPYVALSHPDPTAAEPPIFDYGITWVEGLYKYVENVTRATGTGAVTGVGSVWRCQSASEAADPTDPAYYPATHYVFNGCLVEQPEGIAKSQANLLMVRELGKLTCASLRPTNQTQGDVNTIPTFPFLNYTDYGPNSTKTQLVCRLHGEGSNVLFADGHVKQFSLTYFPDFNSKYNSTYAWDRDTQQWYNYNTNSNIRPRSKMLSIAVTP
jgi:prepilin-type N-terminal cleavage/methylation domain-containing protein/prepilin-type processing-associated H-X9-DG protein